MKPENMLQLLYLIREYNATHDTLEELRYMAIAIGNSYVDKLIDFLEAGKGLLDEQ